MIDIAGTKESAGFGFIGMVGPINVFKFMQVDSAWLNVILIVVAWILDLILRKMIHLYSTDIFKFMG
ncbi:regulatory protein [Staphylococcus saccharolyticus]|uniref:Regulatory protein n=1 Tax=Staphylococcus saccharolyticus TaxID=33028 RepID=A0A380GZQ2_9STAP|nr:regulatory protein [Staphylococcus saccharolyticus]